MHIRFHTKLTCQALGKCAKRNFTDQRTFSIADKHENVNCNEIISIISSTTNILNEVFPRSFSNHNDLPVGSLQWNAITFAISMLSFVRHFSFYPMTRSIETGYFFACSTNADFCVGRVYVVTAFNSLIDISSKS